MGEEHTCASLSYREKSMQNDHQLGWRTAFVERDGKGGDFQFVGGGERLLIF